MELKCIFKLFFCNLFFVKNLFTGHPYLLMRGMLPAPRTELFEIELALDRLLILAYIIIPPLADSAAEPDEIIRMFRFGHLFRKNDE